MSVTLANQQELNEALASFKNSQNGHWLVVTYKTPTQLQYKASGEGLESLAAELNDKEIAYYLIRLVYNSNDAGFKDAVIGEAANTKDIYVNWIGSGVGIIEKGKKKTHSGDAQALLSPHHSTLVQTSKDLNGNFTEAIIKDRSGPLSGSHIID
ncbi:hypothetical protein ACTFIZ_008132 [Dictyostelium cf. discoideum]